MESSVPTPLFLSPLKKKGPERGCAKHRAKSALERNGSIMLLSSLSFTVLFWGFFASGASLGGRGGGRNCLTVYSTSAFKNRETCFTGGDARFIILVKGPFFLTEANE